MKQTYDKDGFIQLVRRTDEEVKKLEKKEKKKKKNPFKKGSWKDTLLKKIRKHKSSKFVEDFHFIKRENVFLIDKKGKLKAIGQKGALDTKDLDDLAEKKKDVKALINTGDGIYLRISMKSYLKFCQIKSVALSIKLICSDDAGEEEYDVYEDDQVFDNINSLLSWINYYRMLINGVAEVQAQLCGFNYIKYVGKVVVEKLDGEIETYKGDLNNFLEAYNFEPLL